RRITYTYDDGCQIILDGDGSDVNAPYIAGPKGNLYPGFVCDVPDWERKLAQFPEPAPQVIDFVDAVQNRKKFALNEENGFRSCTIVNLGLIAMRLNRSLKFDPVNLTFIDDEGANRLIKQPMRSPYIM
ncbi:MAG: gfo/Idh/MocA family oxidoreductase, partial [Bacteroidales bacterium]